MYRRYRERRRRPRRNRTAYRRSVLTRPSVQIAILLVAAFVIFVLLQSAAR